MALTPEQVAWVQASCAAQGVAVHITDPATIAHVVTLLRAGTPERIRAQRGSTAVPPCSEPPHGSNAAEIERASGDRGPVDDRMVEDRFDDRGLPGEVEDGPLGC